MSKHVEFFRVISGSSKWISQSEKKLCFSRLKNQTQQQQKTPFAPFSLLQCCLLYKNKQTGKIYFFHIGCLSCLKLHLFLPGPCFSVFSVFLYSLQLTCHVKCDCFSNSYKRIRGLSSLFRFLKLQWEKFRHPSVILKMYKVCFLQIPGSDNIRNTLDGRPQQQDDCCTNQAEL